MKQALFWFAYLIAITLLFVSCGGGGSGGSSNGNGGVTPPTVILPPDPGSEGKKTLEGIDSNNNGVRDDVEIAIYKYAPKPEQEEVRQAMAQEAKVIQKAILAGSKNDVDEALKVQAGGSNAVSCLIKKSPDMVESKTQLSRVQGFVANTSARTSAYLNYNKMLSGRIFSVSDDPIPCDSDKEKEAKAQAAFNAKTFNVQTAYNLPPDPGEAGKAALEGIDSNNNGVRDDVEIAIYNYAPRPDQERYRAAIIQLAKYMESEIKNASLKDRDKLVEIDKEWSRAIQCVKKENNAPTSVDEIRFLKEVVYNTPQRKKAEVDFETSKRVSGIGAFASYRDDPIPCDYDRLKQ